MAKIVFFMYAQESHFLPTFRLARSLQEQGHHIFYLGLLDFEAFVQAQGFQFVPILTQSFPKGSRERQAAASLNQEAYLRNLGGIRSRLARIGFIRKQFALDKIIVGQRFQQELCHVLLAQDDIQSLVRELKPDLFIVDTFLPAAILMSHQLETHSISLNVTANLHSAKDRFIPPPTSTLIPGRTLFSRLRIRLAWWSSLWGRYVMFWLIKYDFDEKVRRLAILCNYPLKDVETTVFYPYVRSNQNYPELATFPRGLDFPQAERKDICYIESIDLQRREEPFPWERLVSNMPLLYCALGSRGHVYARSRRFYQTVIDVMANKRDWQAIIVIGNHLSVEDFHSVPSNVLLVNWAPQLEVLKRASLMITHAGLGTVKECIYFGVPMIVCPIMGDTPGIAARVVYHGLGVMGSFRKVSVQQVLILLETIEKDASFKQRVRAMASKLREVGASQPGLQVINALLEENVSL